MGVPSHRRTQGNGNAVAPILNDDLSLALALWGQHIASDPVGYMKANDLRPADLSSCELIPSPGQASQNHQALEVRVAILEGQVRAIRRTLSGG